MIYQPSITISDRNGEHRIKVAIRPERRPDPNSEREAFADTMLTLYCVLAYVAIMVGLVPLMVR